MTSTLPIDPRPTSGPVSAATRRDDRGGDRSARFDELMASYSERPERPEAVRRDEPRDDDAKPRDPERPRDHPGLRPRSRIGDRPLLHRADRHERTDRDPASNDPATDSSDAADSAHRRPGTSESDVTPTEHGEASAAPAGQPAVPAVSSEAAATSLTQETPPAVVAASVLAAPAAPATSTTVGDDPTATPIAPAGATVAAGASTAGDDVLTGVEAAALQQVLDPSTEAAVAATGAPSPASGERADEAAATTGVPLPASAAATANEEIATDAGPGGDPGAGSPQGGGNGSGPTITAAQAKPAASSSGDERPSTVATSQARSDAPAAGDPAAAPASTGAAGPSESAGPTVSSTPVGISAPSPERTPAGSVSTAAETTAPPAGAEAPEEPWQQVLTVLRPLRRMGDGSQRMSIRLTPEELGTVNVELSLQRGELSLHLVADSGAARAALADSLHLLRSQLESAGVRTASLEVGHREQAARHDNAGGNANRSSFGDDDTGSSPVIDLRRTTTPISAATVVDGRLDVRI